MDSKLKFILAIGLVILSNLCFGQNYGNHNTGRFTQHTGYVFSNGTSNISASTDSLGVDTISNYSPSSNLVLNSSTNLVNFLNTTTSFGDTSAADGSFVFIDGDSSQFRTVLFRSYGKLRWQIATDADQETGSNVGSNFFIGRASDAGSFIDRPFEIQRDDGGVIIGAATGGSQGLGTINTKGLYIDGVAVTATSPGGSDTQIQYNSSGSFGGISGFTFNSGTGALSINPSGTTTIKSFLPNASTDDIGSSGSPYDDIYADNFFADDGTVTAPGISFFNDTNTGLYRSTTDVFLLTAGGEAPLEIGLIEGNSVVEVQGSLSYDGDIKVISSGAISGPLATTYIIVDTEASAATDDLDNLPDTGDVQGAFVGSIVYITTLVDTRDVTVTETGNIKLGATTRVLNDNEDVLVLMCRGTTWMEVSFSDNN